MGLRPGRQFPQDRVSGVTRLCAFCLATESVAQEPFRPAGVIRKTTEVPTLARSPLRGLIPEAISSWIDRLMPRTIPHRGGHTQQGQRPEFPEHESRGWMGLGPTRYRHYCGAKVLQRSRGWNAIGVCGVAFGVHARASAAMSYLEEHDPGFWSCGASAMLGYYSGLCFRTGCIDGSEDRAFVCYWSLKERFPLFFEPVFGRQIFGRARCQRCSQYFAQLRIRELSIYEDVRSKRYNFAVCDCGHPVWQLDGPFHAVHFALKKKEKEWRRRERLAGARGRHTAREIREILTLRDYRCIYCNGRFSDDRSPTKDHLLGLAAGGSNWAVNIVLSCGSCNSRRCDIPFRTYCRLLSAKQNGRILDFLKRRVRSLDMLQLPGEVLKAFEHALRRHEPDHWRYVDIQRGSASARRNVAQNELLPSTVIRLRNLS